MVLDSTSFRPGGWPLMMFSLEIIAVDRKYIKTFLPWVKSKLYNITVEFMFAGINMFWAQLRLILARSARRGLK